MTARMARTVHQHAVTRQVFLRQILHQLSRLRRARSWRLVGAFTRPVLTLVCYGCGHANLVTYFNEGRRDEEKSVAGIPPISGSLQSSNSKRTKSFRREHVASTTRVTRLAT